MPDSGLPIDAAARELGVTAATVRRWVRAGCPSVRPGRRGRGGALVIDPEVVRAWRDAGAENVRAIELAGRVPHLLATATWQAFTLIEDNPQKVAMAGSFAGAWFMQASAVLDELRRGDPAVGVLVRPWPEPIERLLQIAHRIVNY